MIGHVHPENLRGADQQRALRARRIGRDAAIEQPRQHMAERAEPPQNRRHQAPHQGAVAIGQRLQSGMRGGAVELVVERAMLVQYAVKNIRCDPPRRETWHFGWQCKSLRGHGAGTSRKYRTASRAFRAYAIGGKNTFGSANMPNIRIAFMISQFGYDLLRRDLERAGQCLRLEPAMTDDPSAAAAGRHPGRNASRCRRRPSARSPRPKRDGRPPRPTPSRGEGIAGPEGPEPTRYGDWENKGIASDF